MQVHLPSATLPPSAYVCKCVAGAPLCYDCWHYYRSRNAQLGLVHTAWQHVPVASRPCMPSPALQRGSTALTWDTLDTCTNIEAVSRLLNQLLLFHAHLEATAQNYISWATWDTPGTQLYPPARCRLTKHLTHRHASEGLQERHELQLALATPSRRQRALPCAAAGHMTSPSTTALYPRCRRSRSLLVQCSRAWCVASLRHACSTQGPALPMRLPRGVHAGRPTRSRAGQDGVIRCAWRTGAPRARAGLERRRSSASSGSGAPGRSAGCGVAAGSALG